MSGAHTMSNSPQTLSFCFLVHFHISGANSLERLQKIPQSCNLVNTSQAENPFPFDEFVSILFLVSGKTAKYEMCHSKASAHKQSNDLPVCSDIILIEEAQLYLAKSAWR